MSDLKSLIEKENKAELERQLERLGFFSFNGFLTQTSRINEVESLLYGLINTLLKEGTITQEKLTEIAASVKGEIENKDEKFNSVNLFFDNTALEKAGPPVNCNERLHICKAICCHLDFALSYEEIEGGVIKWDLGIPYKIRKDKDGNCVHINKENKCCNIYDNRPSVCKKYSCVGDKRIWTDFEKMELNTEWIKNNIKEKKVVLQRPQMMDEQ